MGVRRVRRVVLIAVACAGVLVGLWCARELPVAWLLLTVFGITGTVACVVRRSLGMLLLAGVLGLALGWARGAAFLPELRAYDDRMYKPLTLQGTALDDSVYDEHGQITFDASNLMLEDGRSLQGGIIVAGRGVPMVYRGDKVKVTGSLRPTRGSKQARMSFATIAVLERSRNPIHAFRRTFSAGMLSAVSEPHASFGLGLLVGQRDTLPEDVREQLSTVGLTHIIAVSGYNLTIIVLMVRRLTGSRSKYQATVAALGLIVIFLMITGFSASIVRASIVSVLGLLAWYYGRQLHPVVTILFAAAVTAYARPFYIWSDVGWYLSFLAFTGVLVIAPVLTARLFPRSQSAPLIPMVAIETFCAQLMTIPIVLYVFGTLSVVSLVANLLVVPFIPIAMLAALCAGLAGAYMPMLVRFVSWPAELILKYMLETARQMSQLPFAQISLQIPWQVMLGLYMTIAVLVWLVARRNAARRGILTDEHTVSMENM